MGSLINARYLVGKHPLKTEIAHSLGLTESDNFPDSDAEAVVLLASAVTGIDENLVNQWQSFREGYVPVIVAIVDFALGDVDFEDMSAIVGKMLEPVVTPYLVLHEDDGAAAALIDLENFQITDYSTDPTSVRDSDPEHKDLVKDFASELTDSLIEGGWEQFVQGLIIPAIPLIPESKLGVEEINRFLKFIPSRS
jgi:hypothetical protein